MNELIASATTLAPIPALLIIAALLQVALTQWAKQEAWTKTRTQRVAVALAAVLGLVAAVVSGLIIGIPDSVVQAVSAVVVAVAAVILLGKGMYTALGWAIPDGTTTPEERATQLEDRVTAAEDTANTAAATAADARTTADAAALLAQTRNTHRADG